MADGTIEYVLRVTDAATPALQATQREAAELASVLRELETEQHRQQTAAAASVAAHMREQQALVAQAAQVRDVTQAMREQQRIAAQQQSAMSGGAPLSSITATTTALAAQGAAANTAAKGVAAASFQVQNLRYQMIDVGTMLASGASPLMVLATQGGQIAQVFMGGASASTVLTGAIGGLLAPVAFLAPVVASLAYTWHALNDELKAAEANMKAASDAATAMQTAHAGIVDVQAQVVEAHGLATGAITAQDVAYRRQVEAINLALDAQRKLLDVQFAGAEAGSDEANRILAQIVAIEQKRVRLTDLAAATRDAETGTRGHTSAIREQRDAMRELVAEYKAALAYLSGDPTAGLADGFVKDMVAAGKAAADAQAKAEADAQKENLAADRERLAEWTRGRQEAERVAAETYRAEMARQQIIAGQLGTVTSTSLSLASGDVGAALTTAAPAIGGAMAGPIGEAVGSAVAAGVGFLVQLGQDGAASVGTKIDEFRRDLMAGIAELPTLLVEVLPEALGRLAVELVKAQYLLIAQVVRLPITIAEHIGETLADWWPGWDGLKDILRDVWREAIDALRQVIDDVRSLDFGQESALRKGAEVGLRGAAAVGTLGLSELALAGIRGASGGDVSWMATARSNGPAAGGMGMQPRAPAAATGPRVTINTASLHPDFVPGIQAHTDRAFGAYGLRKTPSWGVTSG